MENKITNDKERINFFIKPIYNKKKYSLIDYIKFRLFLRKLKKITPNFDMLMEIYDFLKILKMVYMYNPDMEHCKMYASNKNSTNMIVFDAKKGFNVHISLNEDTRVITIKILRLSDMVSKKAMGSEMSFRDGEAVISDINEENLFINIINYIMDSAVDLLKYYYKNKRRGY